MIVVWFGVQVSCPC